MIKLYAGDIKVTLRYIKLPQEESMTNMPVSINESIRELWHWVIATINIISYICVKPNLLKASG